MNIIIHQTNSLQIGQRRSDGYINLTKMAQANRKLIADYLRLETTKAFLQELSVDMEIPISGKNGLIQIRKGGNNKLNQGTWGNPKVAIHCGQWCSPKFAVLVSKWVFDWLTTAINPVESAQSSSESLAAANAYMKSAQALNRVIHTAIHQQSNAIRDALFVIDPQNTNKVVRSVDPPKSRSKTNICSAVKNPSRSRRLQGYGSGYIGWRISQGKYKQAFYYYEFWSNGDRQVKSSKYIPKKLLKYDEPKPKLN